MNQYKRIFIIGHPGAGKALLAKRLSEKLGWKFIDSDLGLEFRVGRTISHILNKQGEEDFYKLLTDILSSQINQAKIVVTTDASVVCDISLRQLLSKEFVVYLKVSTPVQVKRTTREAEQLLAINDVSEFLNNMHYERDGLYEEVATLTIDGDDSSLENHVLSIIKIMDTDTSQIADTTILDKSDITVFHKQLHIPVHLSNQQARCLKLLALGKTSKEIAKDLDISYRTVEGNIANLIQILGCSSSKELIALYYDKP